MQLRIKKEYEGMILSKFDLEMGLKITLYPDIDPSFYPNFQARGFNVFEEVEETAVEPTQSVSGQKKRKYTRKTNKPNKGE